MAFITTRDGNKLYVKDWGTGRPVILIHGWPLNADSFDDVALALADAGFRAISYDRRGFGRSDQPWDGYNYDTLADDLADVFAATGAKDAAIVGFSMGGGEVARYMSRYSGKDVSQAVLIGSVVPYMAQAPDNTNGFPQAVLEQMIGGIKADRAKFFAAFFRDFYGVSLVSHPVSDELLENSLNIAMMASLKSTIDCAKAFATTDFRPDLAAFTVPTLLIHGTADKTVPIDITAREAVKGIANATLLEYDGEPHGLFATAKDRMIADLLAFLKS